MRSVSLAFLLGLSACDGDDYAGSGAGEPLRVVEGTFHRGELPVDDAAIAPLVTNAGGVGSIVTQGQNSISYSGLLTPDAYSVAIAFPDAGPGYWTVPASGPDVTQDDQLIFQATAEFGREVPYGLQTLSFVALDEKGKPGPRYDVTVCILPETSNNNLAACDPATMPQSAVVSLSWDTDVDLDLVVVAPNGKIVTSKLPTTVLVESGAIPSSQVNDPTTGQITRDSNSDCVIDSIRRESLVFVGEPPPGDYQVFARMHQSCGEAHVNYLVSLYRRTEAEDGTFPVERTDLAQGDFLPLQVSRGDALGTLVTTVTFP